MNWPVISDYVTTILSRKLSPSNPRERSRLKEHVKIRLKFPYNTASRKTKDKKGHMLKIKNLIVLF